MILTEFIKKIFTKNKMEELFDIKIKNFEKYKATKTGKIWSVKSKKFLKGRLHNGYYTINVLNKEFSIHRIIALTFIENSINLPIVNHIDSIKTNNSVDNLEWVTQKENVNKSTIDTSHPRKVIQLDINNNIIKIHDSITEAGNYINLSRHAINKVCLGINKTAGGYLWKYEDDNNNYKLVDLENSKKIENYNNYYIFENGKIYNSQRKSFLKPVINLSGYCYVTLSNKKIKKNYYIHVLVAKYFLLNNDSLKTQVNHKNKIKTDNNVINLEWVTPSENMIHSNINSTKSM
jgi:hypothetical protein